MNYKSITSILALIVLILPIITPVLLVLPVATAQLTPEITNIYNTVYVEEQDVNAVYPGSSIVVEVFTPITAAFTVRVVNANNDSIVYVTQTVKPVEPGYVNVTITLPKKLPGLTTAIDILAVQLYVGTTEYGTKYLSVLPIIEVTPSVATIVDSAGTPLNVTATVYGLPEGTSVDEVDIGPYPYYPEGAVADENGMVVIPITLLDLTGEGIPMGVYTVTFYAEYEIPPKYFGTAELTIKPQVVINLPEREPAGHGLFINIPGYDISNDTITIVGYGFPANAVVTKIRLLNTNFTGVYYDFPYPLDPDFGNKTDENGYFSVGDLMSVKPTNMTAGLYIPVVYTTPPPVTLSNTTTINLNAKGWVAVDLSKMGITGLEGFVNATSQINGSLTYVTTASKQSVNKFDVLNVDIVDGAFSYRLSANLLVNATGSYTIFALYNTTKLPWTTLFNITVPMTYNAGIGANFSFVQFNLTGAYLANIPASPGQYRFNATFYEYANQILLILAEYKLQITGGLVTIVHTPSGKTVTYTTENLTVVGTTVKAPTWSFTDGDLSYKVSWIYDAQTRQATLTVTVTQKETAYEFRNAYYLVRPILVFLVNGMIYRYYPGVLMPGDNVTLIAFGYSPGKDWCTGDLSTQPWCAMLAAQGYENILVVTLDKLTPLLSGPVGKDGNVTFRATIPKETTWGSHYIHGIDSRTYEYSVAVVIGAKAVFKVVLKPETNEVWASYYNTHVDACPCAVYEGKTFCDVCVVYTGDCDYLGDYVEVTVYGLQPGEKLVKLYLNDNPVPSDLITGTPVANENGVLTIVFLVPSLPEGTYRIRIVTSVAGENVAVWVRNTTIDYVSVVPKLLLVSLDSNLTGGKAVLPILVGSGIVRVIGTGFKPGITMDSIIVNMTDAMRTILTNVRYWSVDTNGILIGGKVAGEDIYPALLFPVMQPGKYDIRLAYFDGAIQKLSDPGFIYVVNNLTFAATVSDVNKAADKVLAGVNSSLDKIQTFLNTTRTQLLTQIGTLATKSDIDKVLAAIGDVKNAVVSVNSTVATVGSKVDSGVTTITNSLTSLRSDLSGQILAVAGKADTILSKVSVIYDNVTMIGIKVGKLDDVASKLDSVASSLSGAVNTLTSKLDALPAKIDTAAGDVKNAVNAVSSKVDTVSGKVDTVGSKVDNVGATATNGMYVGVLALVFALLAMVFALLAYNTIRKSVAPK